MGRRTSARGRVVLALAMMWAMAGLAGAAGDAPAPLAPGDHVYTLQHAGKTRHYRVHVPPAFGQGRRLPVVFALHGGGGNMNVQADDRYYGQTGKADAAGYVVVFPNGSSRFRRGQLATWNAGRCCGHARDEGADDLGFIREIVRRLQAEPGIDAQRFYASGMSNGAMMSYRLACEMPEVFRAIAAVAGTDNTERCSPARGVAVLHIHALDDDHVPYLGGTGRRAVQAVDYTSVPATVQKWNSLNRCSGPAETLLDSEGAHCETRRACRDGAEVQLCTTTTGGHSWPGGAKVRGGARGPTALSATDVIWDFFSRH